MKQNIFVFLIALLCVGCASLDRGCSSCAATQMGGDWVVVELTETDAIPYRCWELEGVSLTSEEGSDGIWWKHQTGDLIHISGSYDYVQVDDNNYERALNTLGLDRETCRRIRESTYNLETRSYEY